MKKELDKTLLSVVWYYRNRANGKIYASHHVFSYLVYVLKIDPLDLDIIGYNSSFHDDLFSELRH